MDKDFRQATSSFENSLQFPKFGKDMITSEHPTKMTLIELDTVQQHVRACDIVIKAFDSINVEILRMIVSDSKQALVELNTVKDAEKAVEKLNGEMMYENSFDLTLKFVNGLYSLDRYVEVGTFYDYYDGSYEYLYSHKRPYSDNSSLQPPAKMLKTSQLQMTGDNFSSYNGQLFSTGQYKMPDSNKKQSQSLSSNKDSLTSTNSSWCSNYSPDTSNFYPNYSLNQEFNHGYKHEQSHTFIQSSTPNYISTQRGFDNYNSNQIDLPMFQTDTQRPILEQRNANNIHPKPKTFSDAKAYRRYLNDFRHSKHATSLQEVPNVSKGAVVAVSGVRVGRFSCHDFFNLFDQYGDVLYAMFLHHNDIVLVQMASHQHARKVKESLSKFQLFGCFLTVELSKIAYLNIASFHQESKLLWDGRNYYLPNTYSTNLRGLC